MRDVDTPVFIPLRAQCQDGQPADRLRRQQRLHRADAARHLGHVPAAGERLRRASAPSAREPAFSPGCTPGSAGCCAELQSPLNPGGIAVPAQHLEVTTKDAIRAVLTPPLAVPGTGHGAALGLSPSDLNALIAYIRSL